MKQLKNHFLLIFNIHLLGNNRNVDSNIDFLSHQFDVCMNIWPYIEYVLMVINI